jgi:hypothetical protein
MSRYHAGHYKDKHPNNQCLDPRIAEALKARAKAGRIACARAFGLAEELEASPAEIGRHLDLLEIRIEKCQLGLFGYERSKAVRPAREVAPELKAAIEAGLDAGRLPCQQAWAIAERLGLKKMEVSAAAEALKIKISGCQLGSF